MSNLKFDDLTAANLERLPVFKNAKGGRAHASNDGSDWSLAEWTNATAGEVGEACNLAKKLVRGDFGAPGSEEYMLMLYQLARELADVVIYADIACRRTGHMLGDVVVSKFNEVSRRVNCDIYLRP